MMDVMHGTAGGEMDPHINGISSKLEKSLTLDFDDKMEAYHRHIMDGKAAAKMGDLSKGLEEFKKAYKILPSEKLKGRITRMEEILAEQEDDSEDEDFVTINGLPLFKELHDKLYDYQRNGVSFLYGLYRDGHRGGILADDMGLGKTIQIITFLSGMYDAGHVKHTLLVMPTSLITNWVKEFGKWTPGLRVKEFHGTSKAERNRHLEKVQRRDGVIITTYNMLINNWEQLASHYGREFTWDYVILDEAHKIKCSSTKTAKSAHAVPARNRILLTGTPVQNNLREMWALFDFAFQGSLLGTAKTFKTEYENPITRAREKDATPGEKALGAKMSENLMATIRPYFLRRTKAEVQKKQATKEDANNGEERVDSNGSPIANGETKSGGAVMPKLTRKNDLVVWTYLSKIQEDIYNQFISLDHIKELLTTTRSPLAELTVLKKVCDHPRLLSTRAVAELGMEECLSADQQEETAGSSIEGISDETLISESGKMTFLVQLLQRLREEGHRTLVFARFRKVLDIVQRVLTNRGFKVVRLDGTITKIAEREKLIQRFQRDERYSVFLLTTQVGGVGITLTAANRVVIYDPSWNPATDAQAVDRAYRIGQTQNVVIYRLITCGTVEEKIYRRQVFKDSLIRQTTGDKKNPFRYFSKQELKELFSLEDTRSSNTQIQLQALHSRHRLTDPELDEHIAHLHAMEMFGISDHDLMFSQVANCDDEDPEDAEAQHYIETRVQKAQELMRVESELHAQMAANMQGSTEPAWLRQTGQNGARPSNEKREKTKSPPSPLYNDDELQHSPVAAPVVVDLDQSVEEQENGAQSDSVQIIDDSMDASVGENHAVAGLAEEDVKPSLRDDGSFLQPAPVEEHHDGGQNLSAQMVNITLDDSAAENQAEEKRDSTVNGVLCGVDARDAPFTEVMDTSMKDASIAGAPATDLSLNGFQSVLEKSDADAVSEIVDSPIKDAGVSLKNKRLSVLRLSAGLSMNEDADMNSYSESPQHGNFHLQLEDSDEDMFDGEELDEEQVEARQSKLLSRLQLEGSFDVEKSLNAGRGHESVNGSCLSEMDQSAVPTKKARMIDSEEDEEEESFTPELAGSSSTPLRPAPLALRSRMSCGGNVSAASRPSLIRSLVGRGTASANGSRVAESDQSADSFIATKRNKKKAAVIESEDSEEEEEEEEEEEGDHIHKPVLGTLDDSFAPERAASSSTPLRPAPLGSRRKSCGANVSVASRHSLIKSLVEDLEDDDEEGSTREDEESVSAENFEVDDSEGDFDGSEEIEKDEGSDGEWIDGTNAESDSDDMDQ